MAIHFHGSRETTDLLRRVLDKLDENDGCISGEDLWDGLNWYATYSPLLLNVLMSV